ncbi:MAG: inositol monophosphatase [Alphaproteobacteria bacterium]|jgi:myo-inositol-1(or 4)-monophosphatase|nr:inositol monophosphatase [Alphaproteobacteria bacterium]
MAHSPLLNVMKTSVQKAGRAIARDFGEIENQKIASVSFLENTKLNAEKVLVAELEKSRENFGYVSSTDKKDGKAEERWLINIIGGEDNFARGIPHWSISLALEDATGVVAGVVYDVIRNELYYAQKGYGAFVNNRRLKVGDVKEFNDIIVLSSYNAKSCGAPKTRIAQGMALYNKCVKAIRNMGDVALDIVYLADGKGELTFSNTTQAYEVAAAGIIAKEAGLFVSTLKGEKDFIYEGSILVAPASLHMKSLKLLNV